MDTIKDLRIGIVISSETSPLIVVCLDGTIRFARRNILQSLKDGEIILFEDSKDDYIKWAVRISEFSYFTNIRCNNRDDYDENIYKTKGVCVPKYIMSEHNKFIVNNGYGCQLVIYCKTPLKTYADWRYTKEEHNLIETYFEAKSDFDFNNELIAIDKYLDETDFDSIIESFEIFNEELYLSRPGKDDYYYIEKKCTSFDDRYINSLFPVVGGEVYRDHGWCSYSALKVDFVRRAYMDEEREAIQEAKLKYNKDEHRRFLVSKVYKEYNQKQLRIQEKREKVIKDITHEYANLLRTQRVNIPFANKLNDLLRSFYLGVHHTDIGNHNFCTSISRD